MTYKPKLDDIGSKYLKYLLSNDLPDDIKEELKNRALKEMRKSGRKLLNRALKEKLITKEDWESWKKLKISVAEMHPLLTHYFLLKDGKTTKKDIAVVITMPGTTIYKNRKMFEKKFKNSMRIKTMEEVADELRSLNNEKPNYIG